MKVGVHLQYSKNDMPAEKNKMLGMVLFCSVENEWFEWSVWFFYFFSPKLFFVVSSKWSFYEMKWKTLKNEWTK